MVYLGPEYYAAFLILLTFLPGRIMIEKKVTNEAVVDVSSGEVELQGYDEHATKKLLRKLDWHLIPFMSLIYL